MRNIMWNLPKNWIQEAKVKANRVSSYVWTEGLSKGRGLDCFLSGQVVLRWERVPQLRAIFQKARDTNLVSDSCRINKKLSTTKHEVHMGEDALIHSAGVPYTRWMKCGGSVQQPVWKGLPHVYSCTRLESSCSWWSWLWMVPKSIENSICIHLFMHGGAIQTCHWTCRG